MAQSQTVETRIKSMALEMGANAVGIAAVSDFHKICPEGNRPDDLLKGAKSVITVGKRRYTTGQWLTSNTDLIHRARGGQGNRDTLAATLAGFFESEYGHAAVLVTPGMFDSGMVPPLSLKVCATRQPRYSLDGGWDLPMEVLRNAAEFKRRRRRELPAGCPDRDIKDEPR